MLRKTTFHASTLTKAQLKSIRAALTQCKEAGEARVRGKGFGIKCAKVLGYLAQQEAGTAEGELATGMSSYWPGNVIPRAYSYTGDKGFGKKIACPKGVKTALPAAAAGAVDYA